jgi:hypothetical protein
MQITERLPVFNATHARKTTLGVAYQLASRSGEAVIL